MNPKPLQRTIHNLAMYGGSVYNEKLNHTYKVTPENLSEVLSIIDELNYKPLLRSFNKLTEKMPSGVTYIDYLWFEVVGTDSDCFDKQKFYEDCESGLINLLPIIVLNQLNAWGFNTENLPEDQFIEIETLKIK